MRISCLEMEKAHRIREMESSRRRIEAVKKRLKEIETETDTLMNRIKADTKESSIADTKEGGILSKKQLIRTKGWCSGTKIAVASDRTARQTGERVFPRENGD